MERIKTILEDERPIERIYFDDEVGSQYRVGSNGVTRILPYNENGAIWFAIFKGEHLYGRIPSHMVAVVYQQG